MSTLTQWNPFRRTNELEEGSPLARWNPIHEMERMQREMDQLFNRLTTSPGNGKEAITLPAWTPSVDIAEDDKEYLIKAELPEVKKEDVKVSIEDGVLTLHGERKAEKEEKNKKFHRIERAYGSFERSFGMPDDSDAGKVASEFKDGVLTVHLPKNPNAKPKGIEVKVQ